MPLLSFLKKTFSTPVRAWNTVFEPFTGAWQRNISYERRDVLCYPAVFACITLITSDIAKLPARFMERRNGIWVEVENKVLNLLRNPNSYQNRIQFIESWVTSKVSRGNAYILKVRDGSNRIKELHVLHPDLVTPLVSEDGSVFYQITQDKLAGLKEASVNVPASEIIHDRYNCLFHPLVGLSPLYASGLPAFMGIKALEGSASYFTNQSRPAGILTIPEAVTKAQSDEMAANWQELYSGKNKGRIAVLGGDVKFTPIAMTAEESQLIEQMKMTAEMVCSTFHVPPYKVGVGALPSYNNVQALNVEYLNSALQKLIEDIELCLHDGLDLTPTQKINLDEEGMLRMDTSTQIDALSKAVTGTLMTPNAARMKLNQPAVKGGDSAYLQQQNYSLEALAKRDAKEDPFASGSSQTPPRQDEGTDQGDTEDESKEAAVYYFRKGAR